jgi:hypothetical protein
MRSLGLFSGGCVDPCFFCLSASAALLQLLALSFLQQIFSHPQLSFQLLFSRCFRCCCLCFSFSLLFFYSRIALSLQSKLLYTTHQLCSGE